MTWTEFAHTAERILMFPERLLLVPPFPGFSSKPDAPAPLPPPPKLDDPAALEDLKREIRASVLRVVGLGVRHVLLVPPGGVEKTTSGKLARRATHRRYFEGASVDHPERPAARR